MIHNQVGVQIDFSNSLRVDSPSARTIQLHPQALELIDGRVCGAESMR